MAFIEAYVTNLGKYNEGELASEPLKFPTTTEEVQALLKRIGVDNIQYEEIFIADYDGDLPELNACLGEYESIDELNHLACLLSELDKSDLEKFEAAVASGEHTSGVGDLINLVENLDCYDFYIGVSDDETLGRIYAEDMELINIPENLRDYFDYEAYGRDMRINEDGGFVKGGFFLPNGSQFTEYYHGREDIPDEHKVFAYPQLSIREQMAAYQFETTMLARDLIATVIKTFFEELDDVRDGKRQMNDESPYAGMYASYFNKDRDWFIQADTEEITTFFADDPIYKLEMLTELIYRDARRLTDAGIQAILYRKIIELYEVIDIRSQEFSMDRMNRTTELKQWLTTYEYKS